MTNSFLELLRCPLCGENLKSSKIIEEVQRELEWGTIECLGCSTKYPVVFGIPIMMPPNSKVDGIENDMVDTSLQEGFLVKELTKQIEEGDLDKVQRSLLIFKQPRTSKNGIIKQDGTVSYSNKLEKLLPFRLVRIIGKHNLYFLYWLLTKLSFQDLRFRKLEEKSFKKLMNETSAIGFIHQYFNQQMKSKEIAHYFTYRFGQPRFLTALSLLTTLPKDQKPILDIACGVGHLTHYLSYDNNQQQVVGMERNFVKLYLAKKFIAPKGNFFCGEADQPLPFQDNSFSGIICSDALQYFTNRSLAIREMKRLLTNDGVLVITRIYNRAMQYYKGHSIILPKQLKKYFNDIPNLILTNNEVQSLYIEKSGPDFTAELPMNVLNDTEWITIVASHRNGFFEKNSHFEDWPHAIGHLEINPLYVIGEEDKLGNITLSFRFPSKWYEYENHNWLNYAPKKVQLKKSTFEAISLNIRTPEVDDLIAKWIVIGMPDHYLK